MGNWMRWALGLTVVALAMATAACSSGDGHTAAGTHGSGGSHTSHGSGVGGSVTTEPVAAISFDALFVVNGADATISVVDTDKSELASTIRIQGASYPHHIYMNADRSRLSVAVPGVDLSGGHSGGHEGHGIMGVVLVLGATTGETLLYRTLEASNHNAIFSPGGSEIWTAQMADAGEVLVLDAGDLSPRKTVAVGAMPAEVTFSSDGARAFVANGGSGDVTVIDVGTKEVEDTIGVDETPVGAWQGDGIAYVDNEASRTLTAIDTNTLAIVRTYDLGFTPGMAAAGPDGNVWVTNADAGQVVLLAADSDTTMATIATGAGAHALAFSGDGARAFVSNQEDDSVSVIDVAARRVTKKIAVGPKPNGMVWRRR
jgi:YVTN family beta-propeller protein